METFRFQLILYMDNFTMSKKYSYKCLKRQAKPWKHKCYRYLLDLTFCMSYTVTNKKFIWFQRYKEITKGSLLNENKRMFFYSVILCLYTEEKFLVFHFTLMHLKLYKLYKYLTQTCLTSYLQSLTFPSISIQVTGNIYMPNLTIKRNLYMSGALDACWRKLTTELRKK